MQLLEDLERPIAQEHSLFRAQLLREDIARLRRLEELARGAAVPQARIRESWEALVRARMEKLVGCLSTPVPKPAD